MSYSYTVSESNTFTITHARYLASKVQADLKRMQRFYDYPNDQDISAFTEELSLLLKAGYLDTVTYGFKYNGNWIEPTLIYRSQELYGSGWHDDDPGRVRPGCNVAGATFYSFLTYSNKWNQLSEYERIEFRKTLPVHRTSATTPGINGRVENDRTYSAGGRALNRASVRSHVR